MKWTLHTYVCLEYYTRLYIIHKFEVYVHILYNILYDIKYMITYQVFCMMVLIMYLCSTIFKVQTPSLKFSQIVFAPFQNFFSYFRNVNFCHQTTLQSYTVHIWTWIDLKIWCNDKNYVYYHFSKFQLIWLHEMRDPTIFFKPLQIETQTQNDLQFLLKNSKPLEIMGDILNICLSHLLKILALLMMITKSCHFQN
jgi:hypothetical protein